MVVVVLVLAVAESYSSIVKTLSYKNRYISFLYSTPFSFPLTVLPFCLLLFVSLFTIFHFLTEFKSLIRIIYILIIYIYID